MMLAKLSGMPDQHADLERDHAGQQQRDERQQNVADPPQRDPEQDRDRDERGGAGLHEGRGHGVAGFQDRDGPPDAVGSAARTARANWRRTSLSLGSPFGKTWTRATPSGLIQSLAKSGGMFAAVTGRACRQFLKPRQRHLERSDEHLRALSRIASSASASRSRVAASLFAARRRAGCPVANLVRKSSARSSAAMFSVVGGRGLRRLASVGSSAAAAFSMARAWLLVVRDERLQGHDPGRPPAPSTGARSSASPPPATAPAHRSRWRRSRGRGANRDRSRSTRPWGCAGSSD